MQTHWNISDALHAGPGGSVSGFWASNPSTGIFLAGGARHFQKAHQAQEQLGAGLKLALLLEGQFELGVGGDPFAPVSGASSSLFVSRDDWVLDHRFNAGTRLRYVTLHLEAGLVEDLLEQDLQALYEGVAQKRRSTPAIMTSIANQILHQPFSGVAGRLQESARCFELAALALDMVGIGPTRGNSGIASVPEVQRLRDLKALIDEQWREAPALDELARRFGFGMRKMTVGFRRLFGQSIAEYLRELRMQEAWRLLCAGQSVTLTAEAVGYTLPHFTSAFARRFGVTPGSIACHGTAEPKI